MRRSRERIGKPVVRDRCAYAPERAGARAAPDYSIRCGKALIEELVVRPIEVNQIAFSERADLVVDNPEHANQVTHPVPFGPALECHLPTAIADEEGRIAF